MQPIQPGLLCIAQDLQISKPRSRKIFTFWPTARCSNTSARLAKRIACRCRPRVRCNAMRGGGKNPPNWEPRTARKVDSDTLFSRTRAEDGDSVGGGRPYSMTVDAVTTGHCEVLQKTRKPVGKFMVPTEVATRQNHYRYAVVLNAVSILCE